MNDTNENSNNACAVIGNMPTKNELPLSKDTTKVRGIYGLRNKTKNKWYVGQGVDIHERWGTYRRGSCSRQPKLYGAIKKYGYDDFDKFIIEKCENVDWILDYREMYWIKKLSAFESGYNCTSGGSSGRKSEETKRKIADGQRNMSSEVRERWKLGQIGKRHSEETKKKLSEISKNMSEETRQKMSEAAKRRVRKAFSEAHRENLSAARLGRKHTEETKAKISALQKGKRPWAKEIALAMSRRNIGRKQSSETIEKRMATIKANRLSKVSNIDTQPVLS